MILKTMSIDVAKSCIIYEDNSAALKRTKHITTVSSSEQRMTKVLGKVVFKRFCDIITSDVDLTDVDKRTCVLYSRVFDSRNTFRVEKRVCYILGFLILGIHLGSRTENIFILFSSCADFKYHLYLDYVKKTLQN